MRLVLIISCLTVVTFAEPEPEPGYAYSALSRQTMDTSNHQQGLQQGFIHMNNNGFSSSYSAQNSGQGGFDSGISNGYNNQQSFSNQQQPYTQAFPSQQQQQQQQQQHAQQQDASFEIQPSQGYDLGVSTQQMGQDYNNDQSQNQGFVGHQTYGSPQPQSASLEHSNPESRHNDNTPSIPGLSSQSQHSSRFSPSNRPSPINLPTSRYLAPPVESQSNNFLPQPSSAPAQHSQAAPSNRYIAPPQNTQSPSAPSNRYLAPSAPQDTSSSYQPSNYISSDGYGYPPAKQVIHKHIYVHVPPKEFDDELPRQHFQVPQAQKHYKIIFIKAPSPPTFPPPSIPPIPQNEEKTLIYVLHKKPDELEDVVLPTPEATKPSKPEVYFIKYKTRKDNLPGLYGAPASAPEDNESSAGYGEQQPHSSSTSGFGKSLESETNAPNGQDHSQQINSNGDESSNLHNAGTISQSTPQSASYGPPSKHRLY